MKNVLSERETHRTETSEDWERRELPAAAARAVRDTARAIAATIDTMPGMSDLATTLTDAALIELVDGRAAELPEAVHYALRPPECSAGIAVVDRLPLADTELGPTPGDWRQAAEWSGDPERRRSSFQLDIAMMLLARCAGEPFGWQGQQGGRLVNNILPARGHEHEQSGASSTTLLSPHTEDAFHPERAHLLMLGCMRNPDRVGTTVSSVREVRLNDTQRRRLSEAALPILPDVSYGTDFHQYPANRVATVGESAGHPILRYDPAYTPLDDADDEFRSAYAHLGAELERVCRTAVLEPGQLLLVDNDVVVHGRVPFTPRYDGTDRWLKRVNIRLARRRAPAEARENGYGQRTVTPFGSRTPAAPAVSPAVNEELREYRTEPATRAQPQRPDRRSDHSR
ncbi:TauD/TfdA family dioxygenase [Nocardia terpenica]|nr:TauD/TfdA family dioxygenase [Nocardia terpenica]MBF6103875.1 TauD/TfdA family dioxygenase [Nocardia terpenica]MBF6111751.1 TauD/TfdA family dioxygenase [Nocardia terpenica]MBF6118096.1 TauD/TfdA family dioxygenase [Nocardia terpenica]MBF6155178.1 TauD/TfdA family dioxygenase [Nocardia terpenica]